MLYVLECAVPCRPKRRNYEHPFRIVAKMPAQAVEKVLPYGAQKPCGPKLQRISGRRRRRNGPTPMMPLDNAVFGDAANVSKVHLPVFLRLLVPSAGDLVKVEVFPYGLDFRSAKAEPADLFRYFRHGVCIL